MTSTIQIRHVAAFSLVIAGTVLAASCILVGLLAYGFASVFWMLNLRYLSMGTATEVIAAMLCGMALLGAGLQLIWRGAWLSILTLTGALPVLAANLCILLIEARATDTDLWPVLGLTAILSLISAGALASATGRWTLPSTRTDQRGRDF